MPHSYSKDLRWQAILMKEILGCQVDEDAAALWCYQELSNVMFQKF